MQNPTVWGRKLATNLRDVISKIRPIRPSCPVNPEAVRGETNPFRQYRLEFMAGGGNKEEGWPLCVHQWQEKSPGCPGLLRQPNISPETTFIF